MPRSRTTATMLHPTGRAGPWWYLRTGAVESGIGFVVGIALLASGALGIVSTAVALTDGQHRLRLALVAVALTVAGLAVARICRPPLRLRPSTAFSGVLAAWLTLIACSTATYLVLGTFERPDDALFESVSGYTTTAATVLLDPESVGRGVLTWRAGTQWLGGLGGLLFVVAVLPSLGVGGLDVTTVGPRHGGTSLRGHRTSAQMRRLATLYTTFTMVGVVLYLLAGMGGFDSFTYAATTISTGGFANHAESFSHFDSAAIEWAGIGGMVLGGANMALLYRALRGRELRAVWRSFEMRSYATAVLVGGAVLALVTAPGGGPTLESSRQALFHVASATSTTGHWVGVGWGAWDPGPQVLLLALMGVGAMSGSAGGGFRQVRTLALVASLRRELVRQLHPQAAGRARVGRRPVDDELVSRMVGYQAQYLLVGGIGAVVVAALGTDLPTAVSGAISSLANVGPALGELEPGAGGVLQLPRPARVALLPLMLLGRLEIAPVLVGVALGFGAVRRQVPRSRGM